MEEMFWQLRVIVLILVAFGTAIWLARQYQGWLRTRYESYPKWGLVSVWSCGFSLFILLALFFGYVIDRIAS